MVNFPNVTWTRGSVPKSRSNQKPGGLLVLCSQNHYHLLIQGFHFPQGSLQEAVNQDDLCAHMLRFLCLLSLTPSASNTDTHNIHTHTHAHIHKCTCAHVYIHVPLVKQVTWAIGCEKDNPPIDDKNHYSSAFCDMETVQHPGGRRSPCNACHAAYRRLPPLLSPTLLWIHLLCPGGSEFAASFSSAFELSSLGH